MSVSVGTAGEGQAFSDLLAPMTVAEFRAGYWNQKGVLLPRRPARFARLAFDFDALRRNMQSSPSAEVKAQYFNARGEHKDIVGISPSQMGDYFDAGMTVCITRVDPFLPALAAQVEAWRRSLLFAGRMNFSCYWSPDRAGFGLHYDDRHVFICQMSGSKRWWFSRQPAIAGPQACLLYDPASFAELSARGIPLVEPTEENLESVVLEPGDMLYLPAGTWHKTSAVGESLALTLRTFEASPAHVLETTLRRWFENEEPWRRPLPLVSRSDAPDASAPAPVALALEERLAALKTFVARMTVTDLARAWAQAQVPPGGDGAAPLAGVEPNDRVALRDDVSILRAADARGESCFYVNVGAAELELSLRDNPSFDRIVRAREFTAADARDWGDEPSRWDETKALLETLIAHGILRVLSR